MEKVNEKVYVTEKKDHYSTLSSMSWRVKNLKSPSANYRGGEN